LLIQSLMRAFEVKLMAEAIKFALLSAVGVSRRSGGFGFEGTPLSVRIRCGNPNSLNKRTKTGFASVTRVELSAWQPSKKRLKPSVTVSG
jgi:hypothetical protein